MDGKMMVDVLRLLFGHEDYIRMLEVIDHDMLRKPAVRIQKRKEFENYDTSYTVTINWRLLDQWLEESERVKTGENPKDVS